MSLCLLFCFFWHPSRRKKLRARAFSIVSLGSVSIGFRLLWPPVAPSSGRKSWRATSSQTSMWPNLARALHCLRSDFVERGLATTSLRSGPFRIDDVGFGAARNSEENRLPSLLAQQILC